MRADPGAVARVSDQRQIKLLLVDDHKIFADVLAVRMQSEQIVESIRIACSLNEARADLRHVRPDLILLDLRLNDEVGLDLFTDLREMTHPPDVLILSGTEGARWTVEAFRAGAQGWVNKTAPFETLMFAVAEVLRGNMYLAPPTLKPVLLYLVAHTAAQVVRPSFVDDLTQRQTEVLRCLVEGMSRAECAARLHLSVHTVRTHVQHLLKAADLHSTLALAARARELGVDGIDRQPAGP